MRPIIGCNAVTRDTASIPSRLISASLEPRSLHSLSKLGFGATLSKAVLIKCPPFWGLTVTQCTCILSGNDVIRALLFNCQMIDILVLTCRHISVTGLDPRRFVLVIFNSSFELLVRSSYKYGLFDLFLSP